MRLRSIGLYFFGGKDKEKSLTQIAQKSRNLFAWWQMVLTPTSPTFNSQMFLPENSIYSSLYLTMTIDNDYDRFPGDAEVSALG